MGNNNIPENGNDRLPESAMPPLPEYEEGSLQSKKADIMEQVSREISGGAEPSPSYAHKADLVRNAFYMDDIISVDDEPKQEEEEEPESSADEKPVRKAGLRSWIEAHRVACLVVALTIIAGVVVVGAVWLHSRNSEPGPKGTAVSINSASGDQLAASANTAVISEDPLALNEDAELNSLISRYFKARQDQDIDTYSSLRSYTDSLEQAKLEAKSEYIEGYRNLKCYTKKGPYDDSYMVYVSYDLKLREWDQTVPALETLVVCRKEAEGDVPGELYIYSGSFDEDVVEYIQAVTAQDDVVDLFKRVDSEYQEIMDANPDYEEYMASLKQLIRDGVGVRLAAAADSQTDDDAVSENDADKPAADDAEKEKDDKDSVSQQEVKPAAEFEVEATDYVNVRASDSPEADKLGSVSPGTKLTCKEQLANGWSHVIFDGKDAYIKSDYLKVVGEGLEVKGKVNVISTVNIRAKADINSDLLGVAYAGTTYEMAEEEKDGWTAVIYNGKVAYIKSEYLEVQ